MVNIKKWLNRRGVSSTVIAIILLVVALAIIVSLIIIAGRTGESGMSDLTDKINILRHGGA